MTSEGLYQQFLDRYEAAIKSGDMERLGATVKRVIRWLSVNEPGIAAQAIDLLDGIEPPQPCRNYLSGHEAGEIVRAMEPQPKWTIREVLDMLQRTGKATSEPPYYNDYALATTMLMIQSDEGETLKRALHATDYDERVLALIYHLAVNRLEDEDGKFNIRKYFDLQKQ